MCPAHYTDRIFDFQLVRELQSVDEEWPTPIPFTPARHDASAHHRPSRTEIEDYVEVFEGATDENLRTLFSERTRQANGEPRKWLNGEFVVLDERSAADKTAVVHASCTLLPEQDKNDVIDRSDEPLPDPKWWSWRVAIRDCKWEVPLKVEARRAALHRLCQQ